ncbi:hypothetical protein [Gemmata sp.]|uniref:hypothetical protein n=1 Tax=Gemmata sp. TaxID=1914242 RepID=UPI003F7025AF
MKVVPIVETKRRWVTATVALAFTANDSEHEAADIARCLSATGSHTVLLTYGVGCSLSGVDSTAPDPLKTYIDSTVAITLLPEFIKRAEPYGAFLMGRSDLLFRPDDRHTSCFPLPTATFLIRRR